jgi:hypothetical protein
MHFIDQREAHYEKFWGPIQNQVMHSADVKPVHVDVYTFTPTKERPYFTLITGGMSDLRQNIPSCHPTLNKRAEVMTYTHELQNWMYNVLKGLAEMPFNDETFLHWYHTVPNGIPMTAEPSELTAFLFLPPIFEAEGFSPMIVDGDQTDMLVMVPITERELIFTRERGIEAMLEIFDQQDFDYIINERRSSFV